MMNFHDFEKQVLMPLQQGRYAEILLKKAAVLIQLRGHREWKVQFYRMSKYPIVEIEFDLPNGTETLEFAYEALTELEKGNEADWEVLKRYTDKLIIVRQDGDVFEREDAHITSYLQFRKYDEELYYDDSIVKVVNGRASYAQVIKALREYGVEKGGRSS